MRLYHLGEVMTDEDSLAHYGVKGMKWGQRTKGSSYDIKKARERVFEGQGKLAEARREMKKTHKSNKPAAAEKYAQMKTEFLKNPDRVLATRMTRGEKIYASLASLPTGGVGAAIAIGTTSAVSRRIEYKQETGAYDKK